MRGALCKYELAATLSAILSMKGWRSVPVVLVGRRKLPSLASSGLLHTLFLSSSRSCCRCFTISPVTWPAVF